jgi:hypothetical protein
MDKAVVDAKKAALDQALLGVGSNVGIAFGVILFEEFVRREWITLETFGVVGSSLWNTKLPAYDRTHYAFWNWGLPEHEFMVGKDA